MLLPEHWKHLQNGSDIRGVAISEGNEEENLTPRVVALIAAAFADWINLKTGKTTESLRISIGHDSRISSNELKKAAMEGLWLKGCQVYDFGLGSTPAMFMSTVTPSHEYDGAIMLTASHLPFNRNGMKFFTREGGLEKGDITKLLTAAARLDKETHQSQIEALAKNKAAHQVDFMSVYSQQLVDNIRKNVNAQEYEKPLKGFKIIVDGGNGAGGFFVDKVLKPLGADTEGSQFLEPDGRFPNHIPNPENKEAMASIREATIRSKADLGIIFDTDVDRAAVVDPSGLEINRDRLIALIAAIILEEHPSSTIVTDSVTSNGLAHFISSLGGKHHRFKRGYKNVIDEGIRLNNEGVECHLSIETSGHGAVKENRFLDDGAYLVVKILIKMAQLKPKSISSLIETLQEPKEDVEVRLKITNPDFKPVGEQIIAALRDHCESVPGWSVVPNNYEGVRIAADKESGDGWLLLRLSLHDPVLPLNLQSDSVGGVVKMTKVIEKLMERFSQDCDASELKKIMS